MVNVVRRCAVIGFALAGALLVSPQVTQAASIDFGSAYWGPGGSHSVSWDGYAVTATQPGGAALSWQAGVGFGVDSGLIDGWLGSDDEVNGIELLTVSLPTATTLSGFWISNLFRESVLGLFSYSEVGYYQVNGGAWTEFSANPSGNGLLYVAIAPSIVSTIAFGYPGLSALDVRNDFSVKGLETASLATPEPASLVLLGTGLAAVAARARKRNRRRAA
jgi:hypothetical protein